MLTYHSEKHVGYGVDRFWPSCSHDIANNVGWLCDAGLNYADMKHDGDECGEKYCQWHHLDVKKLQLKQLCARQNCMKCM